MFLQFRATCPDSTLTLSMLVCTLLITNIQVIGQKRTNQADFSHCCKCRACMWYFGVVFQDSEDFWAVAILCGKLQTKGLADLVLFRPHVHLSISVSEAWKHNLASNETTRLCVLDTGHSHSLLYQLVSSSLALLLKKYFYIIEIVTRFTVFSP